MYKEISEMVGLTLSEVTFDDAQDEVLFVSTCGRRFKLYHHQDCCESVTVEEVVGDLSDLVGSPILRAEECSGDVSEIPPGCTELYEVSDSGTWTFYEIATVKGSVTIRWLGESNGYYSEGVDFSEIGE